MSMLENFDRNHLLGSLLDAGCGDLRSHLKMVALTYGDVLCEVDSKLIHVYFPTTAVVSLLSVMGDGAADETTFVGSEGVVGVPLFLGAATSPHRVVVRSTGHAVRLSGQVLLEEFNRSGATQHLLLRYTQALLTQISQNMACHRHHSIHQRFCRWLLSSLDRLPSNVVWHTHESIGGMLGVRRETITKEVGELQAAGLIQNGRGRIVVIDRRRLEARACECYRDINRDFGRLLAGTTDLRQPKLRAAGGYLPVARAATRLQIAPVLA